MISVGIDVSKGKSTVCVMKQGNVIVKAPFETTHGVNDLNDLVKLIKSYSDDVRVVLEDTGHYHLPVVAVLTANDIFVCTVNALRMKKFCDQNLRKAKNDKIDSKKIAMFGLFYWNELTPARQQNSVYNELKTLSRQYHQTVSMLVKAKVNLSNLLDEVMPNIQSVIDDNPRSDKFIDVIERYYHYENIRNMGEKKFTKDYCKWAEKKGYRLNERKAAQIFASAQIGIPTLPNSPVTKLIVQEAVRMIREIQNTRNTIIAQMNELCKNLPEYSAVREMSGVGDTLAPRIIAEIGDIRRFKNKHSLIAYAGIDVPPHQSGQFTATNLHITKRGNSCLRKVGYEIIMCIIQHKPDGDAVYEFIQKKRSEKKSGKVAMIAGLNKFLRVYYGKVSELYEQLEEQSGNLSA